MNKVRMTQPTITPLVEFATIRIKVEDRSNVNNPKSYISEPIDIGLNEVHLQKPHSLGSTVSSNGHSFGNVNKAPVVNKEINREPLKPLPPIDASYNSEITQRSVNKRDGSVSMSMHNLETPNPSKSSTKQSTKWPTASPTKQPTRTPTKQPSTAKPTDQPTTPPTKLPTNAPIDDFQPFYGDSDSTLIDWSRSNAKSWGDIDHDLSEYGSYLLPNEVTGDSAWDQDDNIVDGQSIGNAEDFDNIRGGEPVDADELKIDNLENVHESNQDNVGPFSLTPVYMSCPILFAVCICVICLLNDRIWTKSMASTRKERMMRQIVAQTNDEEALDRFVIEENKNSDDDEQRRTKQEWLRETL